MADSNDLENEKRLINPAHRFQPLELMAVTDSQKDNLKALKEFAESFVLPRLKDGSGFEQPVWVQIEGEPGRGKTAALEAFINYLEDNGVGESVHFQREESGVCGNFSMPKVNSALNPKVEEPPMKEFVRALQEASESPVDKAIRESQEQAASEKDKDKTPKPAKVIVIDDLFMGTAVRDTYNPKKLLNWYDMRLKTFLELVWQMDLRKLVLVTTSNIPQQEIVDSLKITPSNEPNLGISSIKNLAPYISRLNNMPKIALKIEGPDMREELAKTNEKDNPLSKIFGQLKGVTVSGFNVPSSDDMPH